MNQAPVWPLLLLVVAVPLTCVAVVLFVITWAPLMLYVWTFWVIILFCYAHRMVYFYHMRQAPKWVYFVAMPLVLVLYPALFVCLLFVAAIQKPV